MANPSLIAPSQVTLFIGNVAVLTTIIQFLSGVLVCKQYIRYNTTGEASALPFLFGVSSTAVWLLYGSLVEDNKIVFVNFVGLVLMTAYVVVFYKYAYKRREFVRQVMLCGVFGMVMTMYFSNEEDYGRLKIIIGISACTLTLLTVAAPLVKLFHVIRVKNTECLPFHMIVMSFFVSGMWLVYGYLNKDIYLIVPNAICGVLAILQISLFVLYPSTPKMTLLRTMHA